MTMTSTEAGCSSNSSDSPGFDSVAEVYTFTLPDLNTLTDEFRYFVTLVVRVDIAFISILTGNINILELD